MRMGRFNHLGRITVIGVFFFAVELGAQDSAVVGHWQGTVSHAGDSVQVQFDFTEEQDQLSGKFTSLPQRVLEYPLDKKIAFVTPKLHFALGGGNVVFDATLVDDALQGTFHDRELGGGTLRLVRVAPEDPPYSSEDMKFQNGNVVLAGSLYIPKSGGLHPAIVFLQGSGPEVRWGANRFWADYFARRGIAALIYDKRGAGASTGDWRKSDFNDLAGDALAAISLLCTRREIDPKHIGIYGHSQGATIAPLIASKSDSVAFVLANAPTGVPMWESEIYSLHQSVVEAGVRGDALSRADDFIRMMIKYARSGEGWEQLLAASNASKQDPWANALALPPKDYYWWKFFREIAEYDSTIYWRQVHVPVLVVEAENDEHVPVERSLAAINRALSAAGNRDYTTIILPGAPHNFIIHAAPGQPFHWPYLAPGYADLLAAWVRYRTVQVLDKR